MDLRSRTRFGLLALVLTLSATGCAGGAGDEGSPRPAGSSSTRIVAAELETLHQLSALDAIRRLRPQWLRSRTGYAPQTHVDGNPRGRADEALAIVRAVDVQEMRYLNAADATTRFGTNYVSGVILVTTRR